METVENIKGDEPEADALATVHEAWEATIGVDVPITTRALIGKAEGYLRPRTLSALLQAVVTLEAERRERRTYEAALIERGRREVSQMEPFGNGRTA